MIDRGDLHIFCDASQKAFGAVAYVVSDGAALLTSKCKVAPLKTRSLPQLELTAFLVGARLLHHVVSTLTGVDWGKFYLWTDNEASLQWVRNNRSEIVYVKNRVAEILRVKDRYRFRTLHVCSKDNPADKLSRGVSLSSQMEDELWWHGPQWLGDVVS